MDKEGVIYMGPSGETLLIRKGLSRDLREWTWQFSSQTLQEKCFEKGFHSVCSGQPMQLGEDAPRHTEVYKEVGEQREERPVGHYKDAILSWRATECFFLGGEVASREMAPSGTF